MRLAKYCNETAQHKTQTGAFDGEGQPVYSAAAPIACRKEMSGMIIKDVNGQEQKSTEVYYTPTEVTEGDLLDGKMVLTADEYKGRTGTIEGYEIYVGNKGRGKS